MSIINDTTQYVFVYTYVTIPHLNPCQKRVRVLVHYIRCRLWVLENNAKVS